MNKTGNELFKTSSKLTNNPKKKNDKKNSFFHNEKRITFPNDLTLHVVSNKKDLLDFFLTPRNIYNNDPYWIPPLLDEMKNLFDKKNTFWNHAEAKLFILFKKEKIVGRIAGFIDQLYCDTVNEKIGFFGFFECINNYDYAEILLSAVQNWLKSKDITAMQGPINGRIDIGCGFLYDGKDTYPSILSVHCPFFYNSFAESFGLVPIRDFVEHYLDFQTPIPHEIKEKSRKCSKDGIEIRKFNRMRTRKELRWWIPFFLDTFKHHWGFVPVPIDEVRLRYGIKQLRWIVDPNFFLIAEKNNEPVGYIWSTPDYNQILKDINGKNEIINILKLIFNKKKINRGKIQLIGIKKEFRNNDISALLNDKTILEMKKMGYASTIVSIIDTKNEKPMKIMSKTGGKPYRKYRVYTKNIDK